jgi:hypothetical protein
MKQTFVSTSFVLFFLILFVVFGNINCSDTNNMSTTIPTVNNSSLKKPALYKAPDENTPMNEFIPNPAYTYRGEIECKMRLCFCCTDEGRYYEAYDVAGGPAVGSWFTDGSGCLKNLVTTYRGHSYVVYEFNANCEEQYNVPTYFTACTCNTEKDTDTIRCCLEVK